MDGGPELAFVYLAHYALLLALFKGHETQPREPLQQKTGYFAHKLNSRIAEGYKELSSFLDEYAAASKKMLKDVQG